MKKRVSLLLVFVLCITLISTVIPLAGAGEIATGMPEEGVLHSPYYAPLTHKGYTLKKLVVFSRHGLRAPTPKDMDAIRKLTPNQWYAWSANPGELSLKGGVLETIMGEYYRLLCEHEGLFPRNAIPKEGEIRFAANKYFRTVATAKYFSTAMFPVADIFVEHDNPIDDTYDSIFNNTLSYVSDSYIEAALNQFKQKYNVADVASMMNDLVENYQLIEDVLDYQKSETYRDGKTQLAVSDDATVNIKLDKAVKVKGSFSTADSASSGLILQYYEELDDEKAAFGKKLSFEDWQKIGAVKMAGVRRRTVPLLGINAGHPILKELYNEVKLDGRKFAFLCGHESNIAHIVTALGIKDYILPYSVEDAAPVGTNLVFAQWIGEDGKEYMSVNMVYQTADQIRKASKLTLERPPMSYALDLEGMERNSDGLYAANDIVTRFEEVLSAYDNLPKLYP